MSLRSMTFAAFAFGLVIFAALVAVSLPPFAKGLMREVAALDVQVKTRSLSQELARRLFADWEELSDLASEIGTLETDIARARLDGFRGGESVSWAGFADTNGIVLVASDGILEGENLAERAWFANGLTGRFAGDVRNAVLLQKILTPNSDEPLRILDLALPVTDTNGRVLGVLGLHINADWLTEFLTEGAAIRGIDAILVSADGTVAASSLPLTDSDLGNPTLRAAAAGAEKEIEGRWSDGTDAMAYVLPSVTYEDLPNFGWRMVGRVDSNTYSFIQSDVTRQALLIGAAGAAIFFVMAALFAVIVLRPISDLTECATRISKGETVYPPESRTSREAVRLSRALARLSGRAG